MSLKTFDWRLMLLGLVLNSGVVFLINLYGEGTATEAGGAGVLQFVVAFAIGGYLPTFVKKMATLPSDLWAYVCGGPLAAAIVATIVGTTHAYYGSPELAGTMLWSFCNVLLFSSFLVWCKRDIEALPARLRSLAQWL